MAAPPFSPQVVFRADASPGIGGGHVMRCLTLANELRRRGCRCAFATGRDTPETVPALAASGHDLHLLSAPGEAEVEEIATRLGRCHWLVVDHYERDARFEKAARSFAENIMVIDDLANRPHDCDVLLDQTYGRTAQDYRELVPTDARLLLGSDYALLRRDFIAWRLRALARRDGGGAVRRVFVCLGAGATQRWLPDVLRGMAASAVDVVVDVGAGAAASALPALAEIIADMPQVVRVHDFDADMAELMCQADLAIGAGGSMSWERCCMGLPTLLVVLADNQRHLAHVLEKAGAVLNLAGCEVSCREKIRDGVLGVLAETGRLGQMSRRAFALCDGLGTARVAEALFPHYARDGAQIVLRKAREADCRWLFALQQEPETRRFANIRQAPDWAEHARWFATRTSDPSTLLFIIERQGERAGMLRLDRRRAREGEGYTVSIAIAPEQKRRGVARAALELVGEMLAPVDLFAEIDPANRPSLGLFAAVGYEQVATRWFRRRAEKRERGEGAEMRKVQGGDAHG